MRAFHNNPRMEADLKVVQHYSTHKKKGGSTLAPTAQPSTTVQY
jgi:hypothetical protein